MADAPTLKKTERIDTLALKSSLLEAIGINAAKYWELLTRFVQFRLTKAELSAQVPELIGADNVQRHNEFLWALLQNANTCEPPVLAQPLVPRPKFEVEELRLPEYNYDIPSTTASRHLSEDLGVSARPQRRRSLRTPTAGTVRDREGSRESELSPARDRFGEDEGTLLRADGSSGGSKQEASFLSNSRGRRSNSNKGGVLRSQRNTDGADQRESDSTFRKRQRSEAAEQNETRSSKHRRGNDGGSGRSHHLVRDLELEPKGAIRPPLGLAKRDVPPHLPEPVGQPPATMQKWNDSCDRQIHNGKMNAHLITLGGFQLGASSQHYSAPSVCHDLPDELAVAKRLKLIAAEHSLKDVSAECSKCAMAAMKQHLVNVVKRFHGLTSHTSNRIEQPSNSTEAPRVFKRQPMDVRDVMTAFEVAPNMLRESRPERFERITMML